MYLELFRLNELPFRLSPDPQFLYLSKQHARAKAYMESTIWFTDGFVVITGEIGAGKTTLIETFLRELQTDVVIAQVNQTQLSTTEFLQTVLVQFGISPFNMKKAEVLATLNDFLVQQYSSGRKVLLIVDEAQNLSHKVLEEVRLLSGVETTKEKVLRIILAGQPELNDTLSSPKLVQLTQRVRLRFHLTALTRNETTAYIEHRLEVAGSQGRRIFEDATYPIIYRYTGGTPRLINTLCDTAMMAAFGQNRDAVGVGELNAAIAELRWSEFTPAAARKLEAAKPAPAASPASLQNFVTGPLTASPETETAHLDAPAWGSEDPHTVTQTNVVGRILLASEGKTVLERELAPGRVVIGRTPDNDLQIDSKFISRHHCQIVTQLDAA